MLYREIEHISDDGNWTEKEYEGTPEEIAELMMKQPEKLKFEDGFVGSVEGMDINEIAKETVKEIQRNSAMQQKF